VTPAPEVNIAMWARLFRVLADRPDYLRHDLGERIERTAATASPSLSPVDADLIAIASELDLLCGYAVSLLRSKASGSVLDLLGMLSPERLAAVALALPESRRETILRRDPVWARAVAAIDPDTLEAANQLADDVDTFAHEFDNDVRESFGPEYAARLADLDQQVRRRDLGLPHNVSPEDTAQLAGLAPHAEDES